MSSDDYTEWFCEEIKKLIDLISKRALENNPDSLNQQIIEVKRGVDYGTNNPGSINDLLLKVGRQFIDSLQVYIRQMRKPNTGIPPGGQATILAGGGGRERLEPYDIPPSEPTPAAPSKFSVDELKGALATRKKDKVEKKMKGSLDLLREYDEG